MLVDHREELSGIPAQLRALGHDLQAADLPVGDYVLSDDLAVERKSGGDLCSSVKDGRLFDQAMRLQDAYPRAVLLVHGPPSGLPEPAWRGAICKLIEDGVNVLQAADAEDAAAWIDRLARRLVRERRAPRALGRRRAAPTAHASALAMLACAPGVSQTTARALLDHFGTVQAIATADEADLRAVRGVGPTRARALLGVLRADWQTGELFVPAASCRDAEVLVHPGG